MSDEEMNIRYAKEIVKKVPPDKPFKAKLCFDSGRATCLMLSYQEIYGRREAHPVAISAFHNQFKKDVDWLVEYYSRIPNRKADCSPQNTTNETLPF